MYHYENLKPTLFTDEGQRRFLRVRDRVHALLKEAGAVRCSEAMAGENGDSWEILACVDRLVELGEIRQVITLFPPVMQHRVFVNAKEPT